MEPIFTLKEPEGAALPILVEIPHAGLATPDDVRADILVDRDTVLRDADPYVDELWAASPARGATLLAARVSRYVVDLNRAADDVGLDIVPKHPAPRPTQSRGVIWRITTDGRPAIRGPLTHEAFSARIARYHEPYHQTLRETLDRLVARFGFVVLLAAHSMPSTSRDGSMRRADVVPGTRGRTTADPRVIDLIDRHFRSAGLSVRHDDPYRGGYTTGHYGKPSQGIHAVQIELNRALYVDEESSRPKEGPMRWLAGVMGDLVERLGVLDLR